MGIPYIILAGLKFCICQISNGMCVLLVLTKCAIGKRKNFVIRKGVVYPYCACEFLGLVLSRRLATSIASHEQQPRPSGHYIIQNSKDGCQDRKVFVSKCRRENSTAKIKFEPSRLRHSAQSQNQRRTWHRYHQNISSKLAHSVCRV